jgi:hypothetical protein
MQIQITVAFYLMIVRMPIINQTKRKQRLVRLLEEWQERTLILLVGILFSAPIMEIGWSSSIIKNETSI